MTDRSLRPSHVLFIPLGGLPIKINSLSNAAHRAATTTQIHAVWCSSASVRRIFHSLHILFIPLAGLLIKLNRKPRPETGDKRLET